jgi:hypothetical protein
MSSSINLRIYGYNMAQGDTDRHSALDKAIDAHGVYEVVTRLQEIKVLPGTFYLEQTERDIAYVLEYEPIIKHDGIKWYINEITSESKRSAGIAFAQQRKHEKIPVDVSSAERNTPQVQVACNFIECMKLINEKIYNANLEKDYDTINIMVASMTNVIRSTL